MTKLFADTYFYLATLNSDDAGHTRAVEWSKAHRGRLVTTAWVLTEVADAICRPPDRAQFTLLLELLRSDLRTEIVPADQALFDRGADLYARRTDKAWSLTDCISSVVMTERGLTEALTGDHHFEQAGFRALVRE
jgi:uncharacterized protein